METMGSLRRTNYCGEVSMSNVGQEMTVCGSIARARDKGGIIFADLRDTTGILQLVVGPDHDKAVLARLNDGFFAIVTVGTPAARMAQAVHEAMNASRREFNISLSRRGSFTVAIASAEWGETASWDMTLSLAQQRL